MKLCWICPTFGRPECLRQAIADFLAQDYDRDELSMLILDDAGQYENQTGDRWQIVSRDTPFQSLPGKYNALLGLVPRDVEGVVICEDDDRYHALHSQAVAAALQRGCWCKPSRVLSDFAPITGESADGRFHASLAFRRDWLISHGGWPETKRADFDQQLIRYLSNFAQPVDPLTLLLPGLPGVLMRRKFPMTYYFSWGSSGHTHAQSVMRGPDDEGWLARARAAAGPIDYVGKLFQSSRRTSPEPRDIGYFATPGNFDGEN